MRLTADTSVASLMIPRTVSEKISSVSSFPEIIASANFCTIIVRLFSRIFEDTRWIHFTALDFTSTDESSKCYTNAEQILFSNDSSSGS